jgi:hypothetical protein
LEAIENMDAYIETIDENGNMRRLKDVAAYNVAQYLSCYSDVEDLEVQDVPKKIYQNSSF